MIIDFFFIILFSLDQYTLDRREAVAAMLTFRDFIEHPNEHDDVKTGPNKAGTSAQRSASAPSLSGTGTPIATSSKLVIKSAPVVSDSAGAGATAISVLSNDTEGNRRKDKTKDETDGKQVKISLWKRAWRWLTGNEEEGEQNDNAEKDKEKGITGRFIGKEEEITIYPEGIPEQTGKKFVEDLFVGRSSDPNWDYHKKCDEFKKKYPRVTTGCPKDPWVRHDKTKDEVDSQKDPRDYFPLNTRDIEATSSV